MSPLESALLQWNGAEPGDDILSPMASEADFEFDYLEHEASHDHHQVPEWFEAASELIQQTAASQHLDISTDDFVSASEQENMEWSSSYPRKRAVVGKRQNKRSSLAQQKAAVLSNPVLETIEDDSEFDMDIQGGGNTPWTKLLLLEELGTASSWAILLIPYFCFVLSLILDTSNILATSVGPLHAKTPCPVTNTGGGLETSWLHFTHESSCSYPFSLQQQQGVHNYQFQSFRYRAAMHDGWAFVSGPIIDVPPMSVFLRGDSYFDLLSTETAAMVAQGMIVQSTVVMQGDSSTGDWTPVSISTPERLAMHCTADTKKATWESKWSCVSPRIVDVLFSLPGTGILSGEELQIVILYSIETTPYSFHREYAYDDLRRDIGYTQYSYDDIMEVDDASYVYSDTPGASSLLFNTRANRTSDGIEELVKSSSYMVQHESPLYAQINIAVRLSTLMITTIFLIFWCRALDMKVILFGCRCRKTSCGCGAKQGTHEEGIPLTKKQQPPVTKFWWESPWIVFPERRYLLVLLLCLILVQNPLLAYAYFYPVLYQSPKMHAAADCIIGVGVFGILMILHCLFHGLRYHTAEVTRRRAKQQRQVLELRRAATYLVKTDGTHDETEDAISRYLHEYYETYGDADGSGFSALETRLRHDPCGDDWPDFLLPKLLLFFLAITSVVTASLYRFPVANTVHLSQQELHHYNTMYITSSFVQLFIAFAWMVMIARQASRTGWMLRKEPFLSTRPAQLAYRIFISILLLGLVDFILPFFVEFYFLLKKWTFDESTEVSNDRVGDQEIMESSTIDVMLRVLTKVSQRFPYSGSAASVGPGKILYATVCGLIAAFIFLPSSEVSKRRNRHHENTAVMFSTLALSHKRDKRVVVTLARYTQSWRVFPLPIQKVAPASSLLSDIPFKIGLSERSVAYFGRYTPVFCLEVACWLLEASWQAYYSPQEFSSDDDSPCRMSLESIGLKLERCILDKSTDSQVFVATNMYSQVDGEEDSIIVVSFRGTASATNMAIDLKWGQVPLIDQIIGLDDFPMFQVSDKGVNMNDSGDWFWDSPYTRKAVLKSFTPPDNSGGCLSFTRQTEGKTKAKTSFSLGAKAILAATPVARRTLPCVHEGFLEAYSHLRKQVLECVVEVMQRQLAKATERSQLDGVSLVLPKVYVTGHSLGGSLGQLFALDLASNCVLEIPTDHTHAERLNTKEGDEFHVPSRDHPTRSDSGLVNEVFFSPFDDTKWFHHGDQSPPANAKTLRLQPPIALYSYGQPRVGNHAFSRLYKQRVPHTFRVVNEGDALTTLPNAVMLGGQYKHAGLEVMLDEGCTGNIIVGPTVVETMFRFSKVRTSVAAHYLEGYRENLESGLTENELHEYYHGHGITKSLTTQQSSGDLPEWLTQVKRSTVASYV
jgi:hypothetical protein